jgi:hypothetical protein
MRVWNGFVGKTQGVGGRKETIWKTWPLMGDKTKIDLQEIG